MARGLELLRNNAALPGAFPGLKVIGGRVTNTDGSAHDITIETGCKYILFSFARAVGGTTPIACTEGSSTTFVGTKTVVFSAPGSSGVAEYLIIGSNEKDQSYTTADVLTINGFDQ